MSYTFTYLGKEIVDPITTGTGPGEETIVIEFKCEGFSYYARFLNGELQFVKGERPDSYNNWSTPPTQEEISAHDLRREVFNQDHSIVQNWIDSLIDTI